MFQLVIHVINVSVFQIWFHWNGVHIIRSFAHKLNFPTFVLMSALSRSARFFLVAAFIWKFGAPVKGFIDRYFNIISIVFMILLIGGFVLIKYLL